MYRAFTIIELLTTLAISIIATYFISPIFFKIQDYFILNNHINQIRSFFYQVQSKAYYSKQNYSFTIHSDKQDWCIIALEKVDDKKKLSCDCLNLPSCNISGNYLIYKHKHYGVNFRSKSLYPNTFINLDGKSGRVESKCLGLSINKLSETLHFEQNGVVNVIQKNKRSNCNTNL
ncbi:pilus assembly FimT family protein [Ursidibacter sp. B-7004-1]